MKPGLFFFVLMAVAQPARAERITFAVSTGSAMPMTEFHHETLTGGLLKDVGDALARELQMEPAYLVLPRKRVEAALHGAQADLLCDLRPEWLDGKQWNWTESVFSNHMIIASRAETPPLARLSQLSGERVGTVLGYRYPEMESRLGASFERDDAATDELNTSKLLNGRFSYMMSNSLFYDYQRKVHPKGGQLNRAVFTIRQFDTYCALPPQGKLDIDKVNRALASLRKRGDMQAIYDRYRPSR
jgi:polar amino acid transport system substrate-binding protein